MEVGAEFAARRPRSRGVATISINPQQSNLSNAQLVAKAIRQKRTDV